MYRNQIFTFVRFKLFSKFYLSFTRSFFLYGVTYFDRFFLRSVRKGTRIMTPLIICQCLFTKYKSRVGKTVLLSLVLKP